VKPGETLAGFPSKVQNRQRLLNFTSKGLRSFRRLLMLAISTMGSSGQASTPAP
jgi:hypothetical protein